MLSWYRNIQYDGDLCMRNWDLSLTLDKESKKKWSTQLPSNWSNINLVKLKRYLDVTNKQNTTHSFSVT